MRGFLQAKRIIGHTAIEKLGSWRPLWSFFDEETRNRNLKIPSNISLHDDDTNLGEKAALFQTLHKLGLVVSWERLSERHA